MKVSVVLPVYNEQKYIKKCLQSLAKQEDPPDEIIIVDNNCTDRTVDVAKKFKVRVVKESKQGISYARNKGFDAAKYDLIARIDADSVLPADWIKRIKDNFSRYKIDALTGPVIFYDFPFKTPVYAQMYLELFKYVQRGKDTLIGPNMVITKKIWEKIKNDVCMDNTQVHEDVDLAIHLVKAGGKIRTDDKLLAHCSARRLLKHPKSFFIEYSIRLVNTLKIHNHTIYHQRA